MRKHTLSSETGTPLRPAPVEVDTKATSKEAVALKSRSRAFSLTEGGPTYRIERRLGLIRENRPRILWMTGFFVLLTWVPLLVLSALQGTAFGNRVPVSFLRDF